METHLYETPTEMAAAAASHGAARLRAALEEADAAAFIVATGASQLEMLERLASEDLDWHRLHGFHLDEYLGLSIRHPASFRRYLWERFVSRLPLPPAGFHLLDGEADPASVCERAGEAIRAARVEVAFVGIGENGHLAFNDPPADFETEAPYLVVELDEACRRQQLGEGWFPDLDAVPRRAISMSVHRILQARTIVCTVPDERKAEAVRATLEDEISPETPASILRTHPDCHLFLDRAAASRLGGRSRRRDSSSAP